MTKQTTGVDPFPKPSALEKVVLRELIEVGQLCYKRGWSYGTAGNFSIRGRNGIFWQSPTGVNKGSMNPGQFVPIELSSGQKRGKNLGRPSGEMPVHRGIYLACPEALSVVHAHPPALVKASRSGASLKVTDQEMQKHLGCNDHLQTLTLPVVSNVTPKQMAGYASEVGGHLIHQVPLLILQSHGVYAWGSSPEQALSHIEAAEFLCDNWNTFNQNSL